MDSAYNNSMSSKEEGVLQLRVFPPLPEPLHCACGATGQVQEVYSYEDWTEVLISSSGGELQYRFHESREAHTRSDTVPCGRSLEYDRLQLRVRQLVDYIRNGYGSVPDGYIRLSRRVDTQN